MMAARPHQQLAFGRELRRSRNSRWHETNCRSHCFFRRRVAGFVIFGVLIHLPQIVKFRVGDDIFRAKHRRHHGVILIVVFVHAVTTNEMKIGITAVELVANSDDMFRVIVVVNRIGFFLSHNAAIEDIALAGQADLDQLALGQGNQVFIFRIPEPVVFETKILQSVAGFVWIRYHLRRPGTEVLDPAHF